MTRSVRVRREPGPARSQPGRALRLVRHELPQSAAAKLTVRLRRSTARVAGPASLARESARCSVIFHQSLSMLCDCPSITERGVVHRTMLRTEPSRDRRYGCRAQRHQSQRGARLKTWKTRVIKQRRLGAAEGARAARWRRVLLEFIHVHQ